MPHKVFISYSLEDKLVADAACAALEANRIPCWIAPRDILTLEETHSSISDVMAQCQVVLLIYSEASIDSPDVRRELEWAMSTGKMIAPFRVSDIPSFSTKLADSNTHWMDTLTSPLESYLVELCRTVAHLLDKDPTTDQPLWRLNDPARQISSQMPAELAANTDVVQQAVARPVEAPQRSLESSGPWITGSVVNEAKEVKVEPKVIQAASQPAVESKSPWITAPSIQPAPEEQAEPRMIRTQSEPAVLKPISEPVYSWPSPPEPSVALDEPEYSADEDEQVEQRRFWNSSRIAFAVLCCLAVGFIVFLFLRESGSGNFQAHSSPGGKAQSPVPPYIRPAQPGVNYQQPIQIKADSITVVPEGSQSESSNASAKAEPSTGRSVTKTTNDQKAVQLVAEKSTVVQPPKPEPSYPAPVADNKVTSPDVATGPTWTDKATGLMWARADNGENQDTSWNAAIEYCKSLQLDGHGDWTLPTIGQLEGIFDRSVSVREQCCGGKAKIWHVKGNIKLTGWQWSSTPGDSPQTAIYLSFDNGDEYTAPTGSSFSLRALCVRKVK